MKLNAFRATEALSLAKAKDLRVLSSVEILEALEPHHEDNLLMNDDQDDGGGAWAGIALLPSGELQGTRGEKPWGTLIFREDSAGRTSVQEVTVCPADRGENASPFLREGLPHAEAAQAWAELEKVTGTRDLFALWADVRADAEAAQRAAVEEDIRHYLGARASRHLTPKRVSCLAGWCLADTNRVVEEIFGGVTRVTAAHAVTTLAQRYSATYAWHLLRKVSKNPPTEQHPPTAWWVYPV